jgi:hypothetical protein
MDENTTNPAGSEEVADRSVSGHSGKNTGNGTDHPAVGAAAPDSSVTQVSAPGVTRRPTFAELQAAVGPQSDRINFGQTEARYECLEKLAPGVYFRSHPDRKLWQDTVVLIDTDGMDKATYLVQPAMQAALHPWIKRVLLVPCMDQDHNVFVFRIALSDVTLGQRPNRSETTRLRAVEEAIGAWTTIAWDGKKHVSRCADGDLGAPNFPEDLTMDVINWRTFQDHYIGDRNHPIAKYYLGLAPR